MKTFYRHFALPLIAVIAIAGGVAIAQNVSNYFEQGGSRTVIGGSLDVISGGDLDIESGGSFKLAGTAISSSAAELDAYYLTVNFDTVQTASGPTRVPVPAVGDVSNIQVSIETALVAGVTPTFITYISNTTGTTPITGGDVSVLTPVDAGKLGSATPTALNTVAIGDTILIETDGGTTTSSGASFTFTIDR